MKIGIVKETKSPPDKRAPLAPIHCKNLLESIPDLQIHIQPSEVRCFTDDEYRRNGVSISEDLSDCDILMGVKEVNIYDLIPDKTYLFFSHTIKKQEHNKKLLRSILQKHIILIDYEVLTDSSGKRLLGFGRMAGLVGAYNGLRALAIRSGRTRLKPAYKCLDLVEMKHQATNFTMPNIKIAVTGSGRVASGAMELLDTAKATKVQVEEFLGKKQFKMPVYAQVEPGEYVKHKEKHPFDLQHFFKHPYEYINNFNRFLDTTDMLIAAAYWDPRSPALFTEEDVKRKEFSIKIIADISCDINGAVPSTKRTSTIEEPFYDYERFSGNITAPFSHHNNIIMMAVDNLPSELPKDASLEFGDMLCQGVIPALMGKDPEKIIERATIADRGKLTGKYSFLNDWVRE